MSSITHDQILDKLKEIMSELFEIDPSEVKLESHLGEDLGLDSIDAIDLITYLQTLVGKRLRPEDFRSVRTVSDVIAAAQATLDKAEPKLTADENSQDA